MTKPGIVTSVVEECRITLDQRHLDSASLAAMLADARAASDQFAHEGGVEVSWERIWQIDPAPFHPRLINLCDEAARETAGASHRLPSGPLPRRRRDGAPRHSDRDDVRTEPPRHLAQQDRGHSRRAPRLAVRAFDRLASKTWLGWSMTRVELDARAHPATGIQM